MPDRWVLDEDYPEGHLVPMSPEEEAQLERDQAVGVAIVAERAKAEDAEASRLADLRRARIELAQGRIFSSFSDSERTVLDLLLAEAS